MLEVTAIHLNVPAPIPTSMGNIEHPCPTALRWELDGRYEVLLAYPGKTPQVMKLTSTALREHVCDPVKGKYAWEGFKPSGSHASVRRLPCRKTAHPFHLTSTLGSAPSMGKTASL
jgi:hypothetical protein